MKKFFALALAAMMAVSLVGCSSGVSQLSSRWCGNPGVL